VRREWVEQTWEMGWSRRWRRGRYHNTFGLRATAPCQPRRRTRGGDPPREKMWLLLEQRWGARKKRSRLRYGWVLVSGADRGSGNCRMPEMITVLQDIAQQKNIPGSGKDCHCCRITAGRR
jgi:hypothetical protein